MNPHNESVAHADEVVLTKLGAMITQACADPSLELELRLGVLGDGGRRFVPGVSRKHMDVLVSSLDALCALGEDGARDEDLDCHGARRTMRATHDAWTEHEDYHYLDPLAPPRKLRTRATYDGSQLRWTTVHKKVVDSVLLRTRVMDVRVALARELPVADPVVLVPTTHVRIKQRRSFVATRTPFRFDCSFVWCGTTLTEAQQAQVADDPIFEIECELLPDRRAEWLRARGARTAAKSLLTKAANAMRSTGVFFEQA